MSFATTNRLSLSRFVILLYNSRVIDALVECMQPVFCVMERLVPLWPFWLLSDLSSSSKRIIGKAEKNCTASEELLGGLREIVMP